jgi:spoIIIJ-associated protein
MTAEEAADIAEKSRGFLKEILDAMGVESAAVTASVESGIIILNIESGAGGLIIGRGGETLEAFQTILEIYASRVNGGKAKVLVDAENYRARREEKLKEIAERAANDAIAKGKKVFLGSMKASERKLIHTILQDNPKVETRSQGDGDRRQVVVYPVR